MTLNIEDLDNEQAEELFAIHLNGKLRLIQDKLAALTVDIG